MKKRSIAVLIAVAALAIGIKQMCKHKEHELKTSTIYSKYHNQKNEEMEHKSWNEVLLTIENLSKASEELEKQVTKLNNLKEQNFSWLLSSKDIDTQLKEIENIKIILETIVYTHPELIPKLSYTLQLDISHWTEKFNIIFEEMTYFPEGTKISDIEKLFYKLQDGWGRYHPERGETLQSYTAKAFDDKLPNEIERIEYNIKSLESIKNRLKNILQQLSKFNDKESKNLIKKVQENLLNINENIKKFETLRIKFKELQKFLHNTPK